MIENDLNFLLVVENDRTLKGYVSLDDLRGHHGTVGDVAHPMTLTVTPDRNLKEALSTMLTYNLGIVVAVDEVGKLVGILNTRTLVSVVGETYDERGGHWGKITTEGKIL
jgi:osmoprotectant transport system ATP-binding protein